MIRVSVRLSGHLRKFGQGERELTLPSASTVRQMLVAIADGSAELRSILLSPSGEPNGQLLLFVDEEQSHAAHGLVDGQRVTLMLPISGG